MHKLLFHTNYMMVKIFEGFFLSLQGFSGLESETAFKVFMTLRVFPVVEKVFIVVMLLIGSVLIWMNIGALQSGHKKATTQAIKIVKTKIIKDERPINGDVLAASDNLLKKESGLVQSI